MAPLALKLAKGEKLGSSKEEGYMPNGIRVNFFEDKRGSQRAVEMLVKKLAAEIKAFGCCHEVFGTQKVLKGICEESCGETDIDWHDIHVNVLGINHFTWFSSASYKGIDLFPVYRDYIDRHFDQGYEVEGENWMNSSFKCANRGLLILGQNLLCLFLGCIQGLLGRHIADHGCLDVII